MSKRGKMSGEYIQQLWRKANRRKMLDADILATPLSRCLRWGDLLVLGLGHMLSSGIYIMSGLVMKEVAGPASILSWLIAGMVSIINGLSYVQFSVNIPRSGTAYNYVYTILGELSGFVAGWTLILENIIAAACLSRGMSTYIDTLTGNAISNATVGYFGQVDSTLFGEPDFIAGTLSIVAFTIISIGVRSSANVTILATGLNILVLVITAITGYSVGNINTITEAPGGFFPYGINGMFAASGICIYAYIGFDAIAVAAEETAEPTKSLPRAMILCIVCACLLYSSMSFSLMLMVPYDQIDVQIPYAAALIKHGQNWAAGIVSIGALFGMASSLIGQVYCMTRMSYAIACDGLLFSPLKYVNSWTKTPLISIGISGIIATITAVIIRFEELVKMVSIGSLFAMSLMSISLIKLHYLREVDCPFELLRPKELQSSHQSIEQDEKMPILPNSKNSQRLDSIGRMKYFRRVLGDASLDNDFVIGALTVSLLVLATVVTKGLEYIAIANWWAIILLSLSLIATSISFGMLLLFESNKSFAKFSVPLVPWLPTAGLFANFCLMMNLGILRWISLAVWLIIGILIYGLYGFHHSTTHQHEEGSELKRCENEAGDDITENNPQKPIGTQVDH